MTYRAEIDGLRTIAVLPVVFFHAGLSQFSGGFIGVDVFFVISGFLITGIIADELNAGRFSLMRFYERRARRILPALFAVIFVCWAVALVWMRPDQLQDFANSATASIFFYANLYFWRDGSAYFAAASEEQVLLHTWSLSVEEQYYILFPILFFLLWRRGMRTALIGTGVAVAVSFALNDWALRQPWISPSATFYLLPTRAWELLCGAICAIHQKQSGERKNEFVAFLGLIAIFTSILLFDHDTPSPSVYMILPVAGTAAILLFASGTVVGRMLSWRPLVWVGLISYSVYLWHQPLFAFTRIRLLVEPSAAILLCLSALSIVLGWISWRFVERPFRRSGECAVSTLGLVSAVAVSAACLSGLTVLTKQRDGFTSRFAHYDAWKAQVRSHQPIVERECAFHGISNTAIVDQCLDRVEEKILLIGDSHAETLSKPLQHHMQGIGSAVSVVVGHNCFPIPGLVREGQHDSSACEQFQEKIWNFIEDRDDLIVVMFVRWALYLEGTRFDNMEGGVERSPVGKYVVRSADGDGDQDADTLSYLADFLKTRAAGNKLVLLSQYPEAGWDIRAQVAHQPGIVARGLSTPITAYEERNRRLDAMFDELENAGIGVVRLNEMFCDSYVKDRCVIIWEGTSFFLDANHPAPFAATIIAEQVAHELGYKSVGFPKTNSNHLKSSAESSISND